MARTHAMNRTFLYRTALMAGVALVAPIAAFAQAVDYGTLEQMYGQPVTTSATGKPQLASRVPADMVIIDADQIRQSGADNIPDILQFVTGIDIRRYSWGDVQVGIRGYDTPSYPRMLVLIDGRQVYHDDYGYTAWNTIPVQLDEIRQIEIVKGPATALFGFNAAAGVINIVTFDPLLDNVNSVTARGGTQGYGSGSLVATEHFGSTAGVRISTGGYVANGYQLENGASDPFPPRQGTWNISGRWQVTPTLLLRAESGYANAHTLTQITLDTFGNEANDASYWRVGAAADTRLGALDLDIYRNMTIANFEQGGPLNNTADVLVTKISDLLKLNADNTVRLGLEYRNSGIQFSGVDGGTASYDVFAANGMWDWQISRMLELTNAVREDYLQLHDTGYFLPSPGRTREIYDNTTLAALSFNSGLVIRATDKDTIRITAARGLQLPSLIDFAGQILYFGGLVAGAPDLHPTSVWNAELSYDRRLPGLGATLTSSVFFQRNTNLLPFPGYTLSGFYGREPIFSVNNIGSSNEEGFEVGAKGKTRGGLRWNLSYRYASISQDLTASAAQIPNTQIQYANGTPRHEVVWGVGYSLPKWEFDLQARWQSAYTDYLRPALASPGAFPLVIPDYVTLNLRVAYNITKYLSIAGVGEQVNLSNQIETAGETVDRRFFAVARVKF